MNPLAAKPAALPYAAASCLSLRTVVLVAAAHLGVLALVAGMPAVPVAKAASVLTIDLVPSMQPAEVARRLPSPPLPPAKPLPRRAAAPTPPAQLSAPADAAAVASAAPVREAPAAAAADSAPLAPPAPSALPAPVAVSQPRFDADYLSNPAPLYPPLARRLGEKGKVILRVHVEADGRPAQIELKSSSGSPRLDQAATDAVRGWRFVPAQRGAEAVDAWVLVPIVFNLKG